MLYGPSWRCIDAYFDLLLLQYKTLICFQCCTVFLHLMYAY